MAYSLVSATSPKDLLAAIVTFATAQGWTINYDHANGTGSSVGGQIALTSASGDCVVAIGEQSASQNPIAVSGALGADTDGRLYMALADSITPSPPRFWGHPGSLVTSAVDGDRVTINDVWGPMTEVHFFGDDTFIICVVKCDALRWTMFGIGEIDDKGLGLTSKPSFCFSNYQEFWNTNTSGGIPLNANLNNGSAYLGELSPSVTNFYVRIPNGVLDTGLGFASGNIYAAMGASNDHRIMPLRANVPNYPEQTRSGGNGTTMLDHILNVRNFPTTGGVPLWSMPVFYYNLTLDLQCYLGDLPIVRACRLINVATGAELTYGSDIYKVFPWKQRGTPEDAGYNGGTYNNQPNSFDMGWALLKA